jgi:hypothetical protein
MDASLGAIADRPEIRKSWRLGSPVLHIEFLVSDADFWFIPAFDSGGESVPPLATG